MLQTIGESLIDAEKHFIKVLCSSDKAKQVNSELEKTLDDESTTVGDEKAKPDQTQADAEPGAQAKPDQTQADAEPEAQAQADAEPEKHGKAAAPEHSQAGCGALHLLHQSATSASY